MGKTVMVQYSQFDKNEPPSTVVSKQQPTRLYVGNLHVNITADDIQDIFGEFGEVDFVDLQRDAQTGLSKGYAFVQFRDPEAAKRALVQVNGRELVGNTIKVGLVNTTSKLSGTAGDLDEEGGVSLDAHSRVTLMLNYSEVMMM
jgi:RNA-binding protein 39